MEMERLFSWLFTPRSERMRASSNGGAPSVQRSAALFALIFAAALLLSAALSRLFDDNNQFSIPVFILAVSLIARGTRGYVWGVAASVLGVLCVNVIFTYPYWEFDMTLTGYPLTFTAMLLVSLIISTLTSRIKQQEQLRLAVEMERMRANLLRSVSHDLRTPLTSIIGSSSVLMEDEELSPEQRRELLAEINKDARWLARVTENILSITRFSGDEVRLRVEDEVIEEIVASAIVKFRRNHPEIAVQVARPDEILLAPMDATLIEQMLLNLFDNAAAHGGHVQNIRVSIARDGGAARVTVADDGAGISRDALPALFDGVRFAQSDDGRNMGIGLSVCRSIIHAHGGSISAENGADGGARFTFRLPLEKKESDRAAD